MFIDQTTYAQEIIKRYNLDDGRTTSIPVPFKHGLHEFDPNDPPVTPCTPYRQVVGSLMYLMQGTRPDIAFSVGLVSRFLSAPRESHWSVVKQIVRYISGTLDLGISGYADADWGNDLNTRRSVSGYCFIIGNGVVSWRSKRQSLVSRSSTEAEYISASEATAEAVWLRGLLGDMGCPQDNPVGIFEDNRGARDGITSCVNGLRWDR